MREIRKGKEPPWLTTFRLTPRAVFDDCPDKAALREALVAEQRGICCYCMGRIRADTKTRIEHWQPRSSYPDRQLDFSNLLAACSGSEGTPHAHCDVRKRDQELSRNPAEPSHRVEEMIEYSGDGRIYSPDPEFNAEIEDVLALNSGYLRNNRKATLDALLHSLAKTGDLSADNLRRWAAKWNGDDPIGDLEPYCMVVVHWLRKRLRRAT